MPRLPPALNRQAAAENRFLPPLVRVCRDLASARNELRWLRQHARDTVVAKRQCARQSPRTSNSKSQQREVTVQDSLTGPTGTLDRVRFRKSEGTPSWPGNAGSFDGEYAPLSDGDRETKCNTPREPLARRCSSGRGWKRTSLRHDTGSIYRRRLLAGYVARRARGVPLQYILGNQPFGDLEILTQKGVLIPRPDTETYTEHTAELLLSWLSQTAPESHTRRQKLRILDLCSGTGCIALLLHSLLKPPTSHGNLDLDILGADISKDAIDLGERNLQHNIAKGSLHMDAIRDVSFRQMDILQLARLNPSELRRAFNKSGGADGQHGHTPNPNEPWDVIISNPPYISPRDYEAGGKTETSVRKYEPKLALVPPPSTSSLAKSPATDQGDLFYGPLMDLMGGLGAKLLVMEIGDSQQAVRVHELAVKQFTGYRDHAMLFEVWKDDGTERLLSVTQANPNDARETAQSSRDAKDSINVSDRAVVIWAGDLAEWRRSTRWSGWV